jgi:hypothetical protein
MTDVERRLAAADERLSCFEWRSLCPERPRARSLSELGRDLLLVSDAVELRQSFAAGLERIADALAQHFPGNIFWDLDFMAKSLLDRARRTGNGAPEQFDDSVARVVELQHKFGRHSSIRFSYAHDFLYGFDWARWVARDPAAREAVGPYAHEFLVRMKQRAGELAELVLRNDRKYPRLEEGASRNPFGFSRRPDDERRLHEDLATAHLLPIEAWRFDAVPDWRRPFTELREERARALGLEK